MCLGSHKVMQHKCGYHSNRGFVSRYRQNFPRLPTNPLPQPRSTRWWVLVAWRMFASMYAHFVNTTCYGPSASRSMYSREWGKGRLSKRGAFSNFVFTLNNPNPPFLPQQSCLDAWMIESLLLDGRSKGRHGARTSRGVCSSAPRGRGIAQDTAPKVGVSSRLFKSNLCVCQPPSAPLASSPV